MLCDPDQRLLQVSRPLAAIVRATAGRMSDGWRLEIVLPGLIAVELQLCDPRGRRLPPTTGQRQGPVYRAYRGLADGMFAAAQELEPEAAVRLAWGGYFTDGRAWRVGYFDLAGERGRGRSR